MIASKSRMLKNCLQTIKTKGVSVFSEKFLASKSCEISLKFLLPSTEMDTVC